MKDGTELKKESIDFLHNDFSRGFIDFCGLRAIGMGHGRFESRVTIGEQHLQQDGFVHAGLIATMADHTAGYAAYTTVAPETRILTIEFKINYLKPAGGDALICRSRVVSRGKRIIISESEVFALKGDAEKMVSKALVTLMAVPESDLKKTGVTSTT